MCNSLTIYTVFSLFIMLGLAACSSGGESKTNNLPDSTKAVDSLQKVVKTDTTKVDTTTAEFKASAIVMYSSYTQHIPHFEQAASFAPTPDLKKQVGEHSETCKDESKQTWKKNNKGFMKCDCGGIENYVIFSPKNEWIYTHHLASDKKLADFQSVMDKEGLKFDAEGENQIFQILIVRGEWYEVVNTKTGGTWWFDKNMKFIKFLD